MSGGLKEASIEHKSDSISIIYHQKNDSPRYLEIKRGKIYLFLLGLPTLAFITFLLGLIGLFNTGPFHLIKSYRQNAKIKEALSSKEHLEEKVRTLLQENGELKNELEALGRTTTAGTGTLPTPSPVATATLTPVRAEPPAASVLPGLSSLALFKAIPGQKDKSHPPILNLSGFSATTTQDTLNFQFNIIPTVIDDSKISGHIVVLMKNEGGVAFYPAKALAGPDFQVHYTAGESFSTQRFRPVDATFAKPRKAGQYFFGVFIFSRTGDLIHYQSTTLPIKL